jgi:hypothetical protein
MFTGGEINRLLGLKKRLDEKYGGYYGDVPKAKPIQKTRKTYDLKALYHIEINGKTFTTNSLTQFAKDEGLSLGALRRAYYGGGKLSGITVKKL